MRRDHPDGGRPRAPASRSLDKALWPGAGRRTRRHQARPAPLPHARRARACCRISPTGRCSSPDSPTASPARASSRSTGSRPPPFARTVRIYSSHNERDGDYLICENLATLLWLGQMAGLELHAWFSRTEPRARRARAGAASSPARRPRSSARSSTTPTSSSSTSIPTSTRARRRAARSRSCTAAPSPARARLAAPHARDAGRPRPRHLHQDLGPDRPAPLPADRARPRLRRRPRRGRDHRAARAARAAQGRDRRVGGAAPDGQDLLRLQPEQPRQVARGARTRRGAIRPRRCRCRSPGTSWSGSTRPTSPSTPCPTGSRPAGDPWAGILEARAGSRRGRSASESAR